MQNYFIGIVAAKSGRIINSGTRILSMTKDGFRLYAKYYDQIYLKMKDYAKEAKVIESVILKSEGKKSETLLDVGCGTGEHLKHLSHSFKCTGMDINRDMIKIASSKVPSVRFKVANMADFRFAERYDVITCLFSAIGHVQTFANLKRTIRNFNDHLGQKGLLIVEPWVFKKDYIQGHIGLDTYEDEKSRLVRMSSSKMSGSKWTIYMHYLVGEKGTVKHFTETHEMLASDYKDYVEAFRSAGLTNIEYLTDNLWDGCRGLFVSKK